MKKILGVVGGMGPIGTSLFMEMVAVMTKAEKDQDNIRVIVDSNPFIPDRTAFILGESDEDPYPMIKQGAEELIGLGADILAVPCNPAQYFHDRLEKELGVPVLNLIKETANYLKERGITKTGIISTAGTIKTGVYQNTFKECGIECIEPSEEILAHITHIIENNIFLGLPPEMHRFRMVANELKEKGAEVIVLGGTELSAIKRYKRVGSGFIDAMEVMARRAILDCGGETYEYFDELISK